MSEEVKEILEYLKNENFIHEGKGYEASDYELFKKLNLAENETLLDYITNLQEENENLKDFNNKLQATKDRLDKYDKENTMLIEDYKSRCEKAIEYIKKETRWFDSEYASYYGELCNCAGAKNDRLEVLVNPTNLLNVLQGSDNNE